ncbi:MAG: alkyl hydroperoxide reductase [Gemmatimonadaceae bacterium]
MRKLEEKYSEHVAVVGVHSGKYLTERVTDRIREASLRLGATHPVLNDRQFRVWRAYAVRAWPTLVAIDPRGYVVGTHAGEFTVAGIEPFVQRTLATARDAGTLSSEPLHFRVDKSATTRASSLRYPGKVTLDDVEAVSPRIAIADSGNHRVLVGRLQPLGRRARIEHVLGGTRGFADGIGADARFDSPQGMCFGGDHTLYVADAENHAIREVDLISGEVRTLAGTGEQLRTREDMRAGALSSPWDVTLVGRTLYVAMAGVHQIWGIAAQEGGRMSEGGVAADSPLLPRSSLLRIGSGAEEIHDGAYSEAALAQPMGITSAGGRLYFVDAESSAVRWAHTDPSGRVGTIVGTGLFDFGDKDGIGDDVRMQHQQGIARHSDGRLLVADSYNDALKWVDPSSRRAESWLRGFAEPSGVAIGGGLAYVADTNAHRIAVAPLDGGEVEEVELVF